MSSFEHESPNDGAGASKKRAGTAKKADYEVGYKRPPAQTRFKPGQSGNPKGRPKGTPNHRTTVNKVMNEKVSIREGDKIRRVNKFEAVLQAQTNKGMKGDARSAGMVINVMTKTGLLGDQGDPIKASEPAANSNVAYPMPPKKMKQGDVLFEGNVDMDLLTHDEQAELAGLAEFVDENGIEGLSTSQFERSMQLKCKAKGTNRAAA